MILNELYGGQVQLQFNDFGHKYVLLPEGKPVPSVTTIKSVLNKPALVNWAANQAVDHIASCLKPGVSMDEVEINMLLSAARKAHTQKKQDSAEIGSMVHEWLSKFIKGENPDMPVSPLMHKAVSNFLEWKDKHKVKFILSEQPVYSREYNYCGTLDFVAEIEGNLFLGDIKTSNAIYEDYWIQLAAYGIARSEEFPEEDYKHQGIIRISRDGSFEFAVSKDPNACFDAFLACKELYEWQELMKKI